MPNLMGFTSFGFVLHDTTFISHSSLIEPEAVNNFVFFKSQFTRSIIFDREDIPTTAMWHRALCGF